MTVFSTVYDDGSADFTIRYGEENHRFSASPDDGKAVVEYEETLSWRAAIRVKNPAQEVWRNLMLSDEMTDYLEQYDLRAVRQET